MVSGSDRFCDRWHRDYAIDGIKDLDLHHLYRAMGFLGEELSDQAKASPFSPRCVKDLIEEELFFHRRDLFTELDLVFFDKLSQTLTEESTFPRVFDENIVPGNSFKGPVFEGLFAENSGFKIGMMTDGEGVAYFMVGLLQRVGRLQVDKLLVVRDGEESTALDLQEFS